MKDHDMTDAKQILIRLRERLEGERRVWADLKADPGTKAGTAAFCWGRETGLGLAVALVDEEIRKLEKEDTKDNRRQDHE